MTEEGTVAERPVYDGPVIAVPVYAGVSELELGFMLTLARLCAAPEAVKTVNRSRASIVTAGGLVMTPHFMYTTAPAPAAIFIPGGPGAQKASRDALLKQYLHAHAHLPTAVSGSGLLLAGESGLLSGKRVGCSADLLDSAWNYDPADVQADQTVTDGSLTTTPGGFPAWQAALSLARRLWSEEKVQQAVKRLGGPLQPPASRR